MITDEFANQLANLGIAATTVAYTFVRPGRIPWPIRLLGFLPPKPPRDISAMIVLAMASALVSGWIGLLFAFHASIPSGPAVTLVAGVLYVASVLFGRVGGLIWQIFPGRHLEA